MDHAKKSCTLIWGSHRSLDRLAEHIARHESVLRVCPLSTQPGQIGGTEVIRHGDLQCAVRTAGGWRLRISIGKKTENRLVTRMILCAMPENRWEQEISILSDESAPLRIGILVRENPIDAEDLMIAAARLAQKGHQMAFITENLQVAPRDGEAALYAMQETGVLILRSEAPVITPGPNGAVCITVQSRDTGARDQITLEFDRLITIDSEREYPEYRMFLDLLRLRQAEPMERYPIQTLQNRVFIIRDFSGRMQDAADLYRMLQAMERLPRRHADLQPSTVRGKDCAMCLTCYRICPHGVPVISQPADNMYGQAMYIDPEICEGCGICRAECPAQAIETEQSAVLGQTVVMGCENALASYTDQWGDAVRVFSCAGAIGLSDLLAAATAGGLLRPVKVFACYRGKCQHIIGGDRLANRVAYGNRLLAGLGYPALIELERTSAQEREELMRKVGEYIDRR